MQIKLNTNKKLEIIDITSQINDLIDVEYGICNIFTKHSTSAIVVNENEQGLLNDFKNSLNELFLENKTYSHNLIDNNAASHLRSFFLSSSETVPVKDFKLDLGTWQSVFFVELDGPRSNRLIEVTVIGG